MKQCTGCKEDKLFEEFSKSKLCKDGYSFQCKACVKLAKASWKERNLDTYLAKAREYRNRTFKENPARYREARSNWAKRNRDYLNARDAIRRAKKKQALVAWADLKSIRMFYTLAKQLTEQTGIPHQVDHIVPLVNDIVCGLHCEANLQVIPLLENVVKGNRYWPDM